MMQTWRRLGFSSVLTATAVMAMMLLPGCGGGTDAGGSNGLHQEVEIVPPVDAEGNPYPMEDEAT